MRKCNKIAIHYVGEISEKLSRIFDKHHILVHFKHSNTLRLECVL